MSESKEGTKYDVCFVQTSDNLNKPTENLQHAFEAMDSNQLEPMWVTSEECLRVTKKEPKLYVLDPFEGEVFEHLKSFGCRILGPLSILYCLKTNNSLPKRPNPVYSVSMRKITVSCSNISNEKRETIRCKIELMGGFFSKDLTKSVTHLVVGEVGSKKYRVAANFGLSIMMPEWVEDVWYLGQHQLIHALDNAYDKFKCPVFKGLVITVSQLTINERQSIQSLVEENGGSYLAPLKANQTTHLVLTEPTGDKYRYAKNWKIFCVNINWVYDSVKSGYCQDENLYKIDDSSSQYSQPKRSTPNRDMTSNELPLVDCSAINNISVVTQLDETVRSEASAVVNQKNSWTFALESFDLSSLPKYGQFLDGCKIFLTGFNSTHLDKLRKIINIGGGMRFNMYSESISHVVCGNLTEEFLQILKSSSVKPCVVNLNWLLECCKNEKLVEEKPFLCMDSTLLSPEKEIHEMKPISTSKSVSRKDDNICDILTDILKQYSCEENNCDTKANDLRNNKKSIEEDKQKLMVESKNTACEAVTNNKEVNILDISDEDEPSSSSAQLFSGLKFVVIGFGEKDSGILSKMIEDHAGCVYSNDSAFEIDIAIVPIIWQDFSCHASNIITNCWLQKCIEDSRIYDFEENDLFKPVVIPPGRKPFESFVISVSQYTGTERDCLMHLAEVLGATCQEYFVRKANRSRGILSNTHLIVATPEGSKYEASKKWKIPAVKKEWVLDAAKSGSVPPVEEYLVDIPISLHENVFKPFILGEENIKFDDIPQEYVEFPVQAEQSLPKSCREGTRKAINVCSDDVSKNQDISNLVQTRQSLSKSHEKFNGDCAANFMENRDIPKIVEKEQGISNSNQDSAEKSNSDFNINTKENLNIYKLDRNIDLEFAKPFDISNTSTPQRHAIDLDNEIKKEVSPLLSKTESTFNESLNLDQSYKCKFRVSGLLKDLDTSASQEHSFTTSAKRKSLPVEELFGRNLASAIRGVNNKISFPSNGKLDFDKNSFIDDEPKLLEACNVMKNVVICVAKKLSNIQNELNEIVTSFGGSYLWSYDNSCTHFVFTGKTNDLSRDFREARSNGKKIVCPEWVYACKDKNTLVDEESYPHTLKSGMSLTDEIAIVKNSSEEINNSCTQIKDANPLISAADFNQQLNDLLVAAKSAKRRHSKRQFNSLSSSPNHEAGSFHKLHRHISDSFIKPVQQEEIGTEEQDTGSQSQSYPVVWDDPTGRQERERIAALTAESESKKSSENVVNPSTSSNDVNSKRISVNLGVNALERNSPLQEIFTKPKNTTDYQDVKKFMFTNIPEPKKTRFIEIIRQLGGEVSDEKAFDVTATHLILEKPIKNEKLLSSVASGKWILHPQYLTACENKKEFVSEIEFEWGGPSTEEFLQSLPNSTRKIAFCPHRWRLKLNEQTNLKGAFHDWIVLIIADDKTKQSTYSKILEAGGAEVLASNEEIDRLSHVIVDMKKKSLSQVDFSPYVNNKIKCVKPEYLAFYLIENPKPDIENFLIPEVKDLSSSEQSSKRRNLSIATRGSKRTKVS